MSKNMSKKRSSRSSSGLLPCVLAFLMVACSNPAESGMSDTPAGSAAEPEARDESASAAPSGSTSAEAADLDRQMGELGLSGSMAHPYFLARECGASEAQLEAFRARAKRQVEQLAKSEVARFDQNFEAALGVVEQRLELEGPSWKSPENCQWALQTTAG